MSNLKNKKLKEEKKDSPSGNITDDKSVKVTSTEDSKSEPISKTTDNNPKPENKEEIKLSPSEILKMKKEIIVNLRKLINGVEDKNTFNKVKDFQNSWKNLGYVESNKDKSLWTTYNALLDRFYNNRSIYFELKELDRKKNLELKTDICKRAEDLIEKPNIMKSVSKLNELHTEFKNIGPVNRDIQNEIWERLKKASDEIYDKKKDFISNIKESLNENFEKKAALLDQINEIKSFKSNDFKSWNLKSKEVLVLKDKWNMIGGTPKSSSRNISKEFWTSFKEFYSNKSLFFKKMDETYKSNLDLKKTIIDKVNSIKDSTDWQKTSTEIIALQKEWKKIGKVPLKSKDSIYNEFKAACDFFYERKRVEDKDSIKIYEDNLASKEKICLEISELSKNDNINQDEFFKLQVKFLEIGHVPKDKIDQIKKKYQESIDNVVKISSKIMDKDEFDKFKFIIELNSLAKNPYSKNKIIKKKSDIIKKINSIQSEIKNLRNNIYYLKESVAAENLKKEYMLKIDNSDKEIESLKLQLNLINKV